MSATLQLESVAALNKIPRHSVEEAASSTGQVSGEPLLYAMDGMLRYARAYRKAYDSKLSDDGFLGPHWLDAVKGLRGLLNGQGAVAMERNISTDSKSNGAIEEIFWLAMNAAGFEEDDL